MVMDAVQNVLENFVGISSLTKEKHVMMAINKVEMDAIYIVKHYSYKW